MCLLLTYVHIAPGLYVRTIFLGTYEIAAIQNSSRLNFLDVVQTRLQELARNFGNCTLLGDGS